MAETRTTEADIGLRCDHCGKDIGRHTTTWFIARMGEYCSKDCAQHGADELEAVIRKIEEECRRGQ